MRISQRHQSIQEYDTRTFPHDGKGHAEGYAKGASSDEAKKKLADLRESYIKQGREAERGAALALVDQAREEGRVDAFNYRKQANAFYSWRQQCRILRRFLKLINQ